MPKGVDTSPELVARFSAEYLTSGNAAGSARAVGLPETTGTDLAKRLREDPVFIAARAALRTDYLAELIDMRQRMARKALSRFEGEELDVKDVGGDNQIIVDKRYEYGKLVNDAEKNAHGLAKLDAYANESNSGPVEATITIKGAKLAGDDG